MLPTIVFVTGNKGKLLEVSALLAGTVILESKKIDLPELQGSSAEAITRTKACEAFRRTNAPVLIEDVCLGFDAMGGLPGPYIKWFLDKMGPEGLNTMLAGFENKKASALCTFALAFSPREEDCLVFVGEVCGLIVAPRGASGFGWDAVFQPEDGDGGNTYAEMTTADKNCISHRGRGLEKLKAWLTVPANAAMLSASKGCVSADLEPWSPPRSPPRSPSKKVKL